MATALTNRFDEIENLERFYLIWLGNSVNNIEIQQQLRTIINYLITFEDKHQCLQYIQSLSKTDRIILIINRKFGQQILPQIAHLQQIISIYVYCHEKKSNENWIKNSKKIKGILTRQDELIQQIQSDYIQRQFHHIDETFLIHIFNPKLTGEIFLSSSLNNHFIRVRLLNECLFDLEPSLYDKNEFLNLCKQQYKNNLKELNIIDEFEKSYVSERSLWWYTRHSFLSRLLNKAFQLENIHLLLLLRFFICDIKQELTKMKSSESIRVYRAQLMTKEELNILIKFVGKFISINTFLSTSPNREQTRSILTLSTDFELVFFEIDTNYQLDNNQIFGNITSSSYFPNKEEILFMIGSIFQLIHIDRDIDGIWNIQLSLCSNKDQQLQTFIQDKKTELDIIDEDLLSLGFILQDMGKFDDAEKYYHRILNHENNPRCYHALGEVTQKKGDYDSSLKWYKKSFDNDDLNNAITYNSIAVVYSKIHDYTHALESYSKALEIWKKILGEDHPDIAMCFNNMGIIYQEEMKYSEALEYFHKAWNIRQIYLPMEHPSLGQSHACIGNVHYCLKRYDLALEHYNLALENFKKSLFPNHPNIAMIFRNIGLVYQDKGDLQQALLHIEKAAIIYRYSLPNTHPDIIQIEKIIQKISSKL